MTILLATMLVLHVLLGVIGTMSAYVVWRELLRSQPRPSWLKWYSLTTWVTWLGAWLAGGYYYVFYYGEQVKPVIKAGEYAWAHSVVTEWKEHVFLFLPFLAFATWFELRSSQLTHQRALVWSSGVMWLLSLCITAAGVLISGAVQ
ncbi:MAG: hypothetical protein ACD_41C00299G0011 [uncultured bacterium]|nr:MAG: hypothetical protein ACD_41C00299G0011 [uncultured bacterium]HBY74274.1 hypothetical protein [Candidatus Kerfeldbacteria bacterium]